MCRRDTVLNKCSYVGTKGLCGKPCFRGVCCLHTNRKSLPLCTHCGVRGTTSKTGICSAIETKCRWRAQVRCHQLQASSDVMDDIIDEILSWNITTPQCPIAQENQPSAVPVIDGLSR
jgi:hypothetical protein